MTQAEAEAMIAARKAELAAQGFTVGGEEEPPIVPVEERVLGEVRGDLRREVLAALGVTEEEVDSIDPDEYESVARRILADRELAEKTIADRKEQLDKRLAEEAAAVHTSFTLPMAREVGCPMCGKADPFSGTDEEVCTCGFDWGDGK
jgi:hypothetical protein